MSLVRVDGKDTQRLKTFEEARPEVVGAAKEEAVTQALESEGIKGEAGKIGIGAGAGAHQRAARARGAHGSPPTDLAAERAR